MNSLIAILFQFSLKFYFNILYYFNYIFFHFLIQSFPFIFKEMSYNNIGDDDSFLQPEDVYFLQHPEIESSSNTIGGFSRDDVNFLSRPTTKNKSFIWNYCERLPNGWKCIVK